MKMGIRFVIVFLAIGLILLSDKWTTYAEEKQSIRTDVKFEYVVDKKSGDAVPTLTIRYTDFADNYNSRSETYSFEELTIKKPSLGKLDFISNQSSDTMFIMEGSSKVYWNNNYTIISDSKTYVSILYEFDQATSKMKVIKKVTGKNRYNGRIDFFPRFKGYVINQDSYNSNYNNDVEVYSLPDNKLLGKVGFANTESDRMTLDENLHGFTRVPAPKTLIVGKYETMIGYYGQKYIGSTYYEMFSDGTLKKLTARPANSNVKWEKKVGSITYAHYYDEKKKQWVIGSKTSGKSSYTPLIREGTEGVANFSPNNKYLLITEYSLDAKTKKRISYVTLVIDAKKGKLLYELPEFDRKMFKGYSKGSYIPHIYQWAYGDELVRVYFFSRTRDGYLNLSSGIFTGSNYDSRVEYSTSYTGNYGDLLSPEVSPEFMLDGKTRITLPAQGAFLSANDVWYVGLRDFSKAIGATISIQKGEISVSRDNKNMLVNPDTIISFKNRTYVPVKDLRSGLGLKLQMSALETITY